MAITITIIAQPYLKETFLKQIRSTVIFEDVPVDLIFNWDQMGLNYVPVSSWTMEKEGAKRVEIKGLDDIGR